MLALAMGVVAGSATSAVVSWITRRTAQRKLDERLDRIEHMLTVPDQAWYWIPEWQAGELEADSDRLMGHSNRHESGEAFLSALDAIPAAETAGTSSSRGAA
jgi:hypothetical protein